jgi:hypothetical protein
MASGRPISDVHLLPDDVKAMIPPRRTRQLPAPDVLETADVITESSARVARTRQLVPVGNQSVMTRDQPKMPPSGRSSQPTYSSLNAKKPLSGWFSQPKTVRNFSICLLLTIGFIVVVLSAGMMQRSSGEQLLSNNGGQVYSVQVGGDLATTWQKETPIPPKTPIPTQTVANPYSVLGKPTISVDVINQVLAAYQSPAAGKGKALYDLGVQYGIDPAFALAFFMHESTFGKNGIASESLSLGNLRCIPDHECKNNFAYFASWDDGFRSWYELIRNLYVAQWGRATIEQIIPKYAPSADNNNELAYIASVEHAVDTWRNGGIMVSA